MKKIIFFIALTILGGIILSSPVFAATTISLSPTTVNITAGQTFNLNVAVDSQGVKNYTVKLELKYPADLLEVKSFTLGSNWIPVIAVGYDTTIENANTNGVLIKTAGYPNPGLSSAATFGTVSFLAKKAGTGIIQTGTGSIALNASSQNVFSGSVQTSVTIAAVILPPPPPLPPPQTTTPPTAPPAEEEPSGEEEEAEIVPQEQTTTPALLGKNFEEIVAIDSLLASIGTTISSLRNITIVAAVILIIILIIPWIIRKRKKI